MISLKSPTLEPLTLGGTIPASLCSTNVMLPSANFGHASIEYAKAQASASKYIHRRKLILHQRFLLSLSNLRCRDPKKHNRLLQNKMNPPTLSDVHQLRTATGELTCCLSLTASLNAHRLMPGLSSAQAHCL